MTCWFLLPLATSSAGWVLVTLLTYGQVIGSKAKTALSEVTARRD